MLGGWFRATAFGGGQGHLAVGAGGERDEETKLMGEEEEMKKRGVVHPFWGGLVIYIFILFLSSD